MAVNHSTGGWPEPKRWGYSLRSPGGHMVLWGAFGRELGQTGNPRTAWVGFFHGARLSE